MQLVFYDEAEKAHEPTNAFPIETQPSAKILVSSVTFSADQDFKAGHKYNVMVTRLVGRARRRLRADELTTSVR